MKAVKDNREYTVTEDNKESFRADGYDIQDDHGQIIEYGAGKTVPLEKYVELLMKYEALEDELVKTKTQPKTSNRRKKSDSK